MWGWICHLGPWDFHLDTGIFSWYGGGGVIA